MNVSIKYHRNKSCLFLCHSLVYLFMTSSKSQALTPASNSNFNNLPNSKVAMEGDCTLVCDANSVQMSKSITEKNERNRSRKVAFSAFRNENNLFKSTRGRGSVVVFDYVAVNLGESYDKLTSEFIAPVDGVYNFNFNVFKHYNRETLSIALTVNKEVVFIAFADGNTANHEMAQNGGITFLRKNSVVRIEVLEGNLDTGWEKSTFSGYLVYESDY